MLNAQAAPLSRLRSRPRSRERPQRNLWIDAWRQLIANRLAVGGLVIVVIFVLAALFGPALAPHDFLAQDTGNALAGPTADHWLGTDALGRDIFSRLLYGARSAALVALTTTAISLAIGIAIGMTAAFLEGRVDAWLMWVTDITMSIPAILLAMLINTALKYRFVGWFDGMYLQTRNPLFLNTWWLDFVLVFGAIALISWPSYARLIRGQAIMNRQAMYVEAARSIGASERWIMLRHLVPNSLGPVIVAVTQGMGAAILLESSLSFLGIGIQPPNASWGSMLTDSLSLWRSFPHLMLVPALTIAVIQIAFIFLGDGLNDALNPRHRRRKRTTDAAVRNRGMISLVGNLAPTTVGMDIVSMLYSGATLRTIGGGSRSDLEEMNRVIAAHRMRPVIDRVFPFVEASAVVSFMAHGAHSGKVVISH